MKIHLQGIGEREAIPARSVVGDVMICNYGYTQCVVGVAHHKGSKTNRELFNEADALTKYQIIVDFIRNHGEFGAKDAFRRWLDEEVS